MWSGQMREFIFKRQSKTKCQSYIVSSHIGGTSLASQFPAELLVWEHQKEKKKITENDSVLYAVQPLSCV